MKVLQLVDSIDYVRNNCFQHQLAEALEKQHDVTMCPIGQGFDPSQYDRVISTLKQRTLLKYREDLASKLGDAEVVVYDQDPWEAFRDDGPFKGSYDMISAALNVKAYAVTTEWWTRFLETRGYPSRFVKMWLLPKYCDRGPEWDSRDVSVGFIGSLHPRRKRLFDEIESNGHKVEQLNGVSYGAFLKSLHKIKVFVHCEDEPLIVDGAPTNLGLGMWIKDIEACARGCWSVRNWCNDDRDDVRQVDTYMAGVQSLSLYDDEVRAHNIIETLNAFDSRDRQAAIDRSVEFIRDADVWKDTVSVLCDP